MPGRMVNLMPTQRMEAAIRAPARAFALALALIIGPALAGCDRAKAPGATPTSAPPTIAPTPTEAPPTLDGAARLEHEGEYERAASAYAAVAAASSGAARDDAVLGQARTLARTGRDDEARRALATALASAPAADDASTARFALGRALAAVGDATGALDSLDRYVAAGGVLTPYAQAERAPLLAALGRYDEAAAAGDSVMAAPLPADKGAFAFRLAAAFEDAGADSAALAWYARVEPNEGDGASALARMGGIRRRLGDAAWADGYAIAIARYPGSASAIDLLGALDDAAVPVSDYARGVVLYRAFRDDDARAAFERAEASGDNAGSAAYYLAAIAERAGDDAAAIDAYARAVATDPSGPLADDALWWRARLLGAAGRHEEAGAAFAALASEYPASARASEARFQQGMMLYHAGDIDGASYAWGGVAAGDAPADERARALFWQARALRSASRPGADAAFARVIDAYPDEFYALRAAALLGRDAGGASKPDLAPVAPDWPAIAAWVLAQRGIDPETAAPALITDARWATGAALDDAGMHAESMAVYRSMIADNGGEDAVELYRMLRRFHAEGRAALAASAARTLYRSAPDFQRPDPALLRLAYPPAYGDLAVRAAAGEGIDPLLLLALVRQESFYDPLAGSPAGALGLTQVIEPTGEALAEALGIAGFTMSDLYRPALSLRFGARYLADQLAAFHGNIYHAIAAYNGGPGAAADAMETAGDDIDQFVEDLEFDETRLYVRLVMENYARYRQLYGGISGLSLPR